MARPIAPLTPRDIEVLHDLVAFMFSPHAPTWARPLDIGGTNGSHHSATLAKLTKRGLVERVQRGTLDLFPGATRGAWQYRATASGMALVGAGKTEETVT